MIQNLTNRAFPVFDAKARTADESSPTILNPGYGAMELFLHCTARSGTSPTLDVKVQEYVTGLDAWVDLPGAAFAQLTNVTSAPVRMLVALGVTPATATHVNQVPPRQFRVFADVGGTNPSFTFAVQGVFLKT